MKLVNNLIYFLYYFLFFNMPNGRYLKLFTVLRSWYVCKVMKLGEFHKDTRIQNKVYLSKFGRITIGRNCQINEHVFIQGAIIGNNVMIAPYVSILNNIKKIDRLDIPMNMQGWKEKNKKAIIEEDVWIGRQAIIMPGVTIHKGAVIGAGSVVTKDVAPYTVVAGVPAKIVRSRK